MFLHALHASDAAHQQILIKSSDTDIEVLACYFREYISADIFLLSGTKSRARFIFYSKNHIFSYPSSIWLVPVAMESKNLKSDNTFG